MSVTAEQQQADMVELKHVAARDISPVTLTVVHSALQQRAASAAPLDQRLVSVY